jgi:hypothetical protein
MREVFQRFPVTHTPVSQDVTRHRDAHHAQRNRHSGHHALPGNLCNSYSKPMGISACIQGGMRVCEPKQQQLGSLHGGAAISVQEDVQGAGTRCGSVNRPGLGALRTEHNWAAACRWPSGFGSMSSSMSGSTGVGVGPRSARPDHALPGRPKGERGGRRPRFMNPNLRHHWRPNGMLTAAGGRIAWLSGATWGKGTAGKESSVQPFRRGTPYTLWGVQSHRGETRRLWSLELGSVSRGICWRRWGCGLRGLRGGVPCMPG